MALWLVRAGSHGEHETRFLDEKRVYLTWDGLKTDLGSLVDRKALLTVLDTTYPGEKPKRLANWSTQIWPFAKAMQPGDWVVLPLKTKPAIYIGEITGPYVFAPDLPDPYFHYRTVKWVGEDLPRTAFAQDLLYSFGAFMTICRIQRNQAEERVKAMAKNQWKPETTTKLVYEPDAPVDLEQLARDQITKLVAARFKGHSLTRLVEAILAAKGYKTYRSPEGPDGGVDLLAAPAPFGFGEPRICVQVKSQDAPLDLPKLNELKGAMQGCQANQGLLVCWGGFKSSFDKQVAPHFFQVRLWDQAELINQLLENYESLDEGIRSELPLRKVWSLALDEEGLGEIEGAPMTTSNL